MELRKVLEIHKYQGDLWYINPYIENGAIVRNSVYKKKRSRCYVGWCCYTFEECFGKGVYYSGGLGEKIDETTEINVRNIRVFTTRDEAKQALVDFEKQHAYEISESVDREIKSLEAQKAQIDAKIAKLNEIRAKAFKNISTCFIKKS
jgi:hypothetical protein